jgi:uncharacterized membrane-anchored protein YitT (DUF2179 family)
MIRDQFAVLLQDLRDLLLNPGIQFFEVSGIARCIGGVGVGICRIKRGESSGNVIGPDHYIGRAHPDVRIGSAVLVVAVVVFVLGVVVVFVRHRRIIGSRFGCCWGRVLGGLGRSALAARGQGNHEQQRMPESRLALPLLPNQQSFAASWN